jgi:hypothetical protein
MNQRLVLGDGMNLLLNRNDGWQRWGIKFLEEVARNRCIPPVGIPEDRDRSFR